MKSGSFMGNTIPGMILFSRLSLFRAPFYRDKQSVLNRVTIVFFAIFYGNFETSRLVVCKTWFYLFALLLTFWIAKTGVRGQTRRQALLHPWLGRVRSGLGLAKIFGVSIFKLHS